MSEVGHRPWWTRLTLGTVVSLGLALCSGGAFVFQQVVGLHDMEGVVARLAVTVDDLQRWRGETDKSRADHLAELKDRLSVLDNKISGVSGQVDVVRTQQESNSQSLDETRQDVRAIAGSLGLPQHGRR